MKERILYFDLLKGTAIFLVVMGLLIELASLVAEHKFYAFGRQQFCGT